MNNEGIKVLHNVCKVLIQCGQTTIILEAIKLNYMRWKNDVVLVIIRNYIYFLSITVNSIY